VSRIETTTHGVAPGDVRTWALALDTPAARAERLVELAWTASIEVHSLRRDPPERRSAGPFARRPSADVLSLFTLHDEHLLTADSIGEILLSDPDDIAWQIEVFTRMQQAALNPSASRAVLDGLATRSTDNSQDTYERTSSWASAREVTSTR
jgi:hypothetical protein